jgi:tetratricopeptide (TPR) repeat protein
VAGNVDGCLTEQSNALEHAGRARDPEWQASALSGLIDAHYARGRMRAAFDCASRCLDLCRQHGLGRIEVGQRYILGVVRRYLNQLEAGLRDILAAAEMADKVGHRRAQMYARMLQGEFLIEAAQADLAAAPLEQSLALAEMMHNDRFKAYVMYQQARALLARDRRAEAKVLLDDALANSRRTGVTFIGPRLLATLAIVTADPERRRLALAEGEAVLQMPCLAHNALWFHRDAIEACLDAKDWKGASRYADLLETYTRPEALPWADFFIARGRALARCGAGAADRATLAMLDDLRATAERIGFRTALPAIERALAEG